MPWNPDIYRQFEKERSAPFEDLLTLIERRNGLDVIDLGCGTGELTRRLAEELPDSNVLGIDNSPQMLAKAMPLAGANLHFEQAQLEEVTGRYDLVFSNAAIQWVPDHHALIPKLISLVRPGGQLVVQLPSNHKSVSHTAIIETASEARFHDALNGWTRPSPVLTVGEDAGLLYKHGGRKLTVFEKVYPHVLENADAVREWTKGTALVPYLEKLPAELHSDFLARYTERLRAHWPERPVFFGFNRILFAASIETA